MSDSPTATAIASPRRVSNGLPDEQLTPEQVLAFRRMTPARRLALAEGLYWSAREWKAGWLRARHPAWTEQQVRDEVRRIFSNARG